MSSKDTDDTLGEELRRTVLKASAATESTLGLASAASGPIAADEHGGEESREDDDLDELDGSEVEILAGHAGFTDEVAAMVTLDFSVDDAGDDDDDDDDGARTIRSHLAGAGTIIFAEVTWESGETSDWHRHPGIAFVNMVEGEVDLTWDRGCVTWTYAAGDAFFDPEEVYNADNASDDEQARAIVIFLGVPDGEPATVWVEPRDC